MQGDRKEVGIYRIRIWKVSKRKNTTGKGFSGGYKVESKV